MDEISVLLKVFLFTIETCRVYCTVYKMSHSYAGVTFSSHFLLSDVAFYHPLYIILSQ